MGELEIYHFKTEQELINGLEEIGASAEKVNEVVEHVVNSHYSKTKELEYEAGGYLVTLTRKQGEECYNVDVFLIHAEASPRDSIEIALAPKNPSEDDYRDARKAGWRPGR